MKLALSYPCLRPSRNHIFLHPAQPQWEVSTGCPRGKLRGREKCFVHVAPPADGAAAVPALTSPQMVAKPWKWRLPDFLLKLPGSSVPTKPELGSIRSCEARRWREASPSILSFSHRPMHSNTAARRHRKTDPYMCRRPCDRL